MCIQFFLFFEIIFPNIVYYLCEISVILTVVARIVFCARYFVRS